MQVGLHIDADARDGALGQVEEAQKEAGIRLYRAGRRTARGTLTPAGGACGCARGPVREASQTGVRLRAGGTETPSGQRRKRATPCDA